MIRIYIFIKVKCLIRKYITNLLLIVIALTNTCSKSHNKCIHRSSILGPSIVDNLTACLQDTLKHSSLAACPSISLQDKFKEKNIQLTKETKEDTELITDQTKRYILEHM